MHSVGPKNRCLHQSRCTKESMLVQNMLTCGCAIAACGAGMGLALAGGIGLAMRQHGLACDNILAAQIVIANGSLVISLGLVHDSAMYTKPCRHSQSILLQYANPQGIAVGQLRA